MNPHQPQPQRNFGGLRFPDIVEPPPGPLTILSAQLAKEEKAPPASPAVSRILADLPARVRTKVLQKNYMHVLDRIAQRWSDPVALRQLFDELIFESQHGRSGLSFDAIVELTEFNEYVKRVRFRDRPSVWDQALGLF